MARRVNNGVDRRSAPRLSPDRTSWLEIAILRPGKEVRVVNLSRGGALVESPTRILPGSRTELQLVGERRRRVRGHIGRCVVSALNPVCYQAALIFEEQLGGLSGHDAEPPLSPEA
jgi:hypothetical protein